ncbi:hypothetical protein ACA910_001791 [Epithemia clementina (nom. ined.)]
MGNCRSVLIPSSINHHSVSPRSAATTPAEEEQDLLQKLEQDRREGRALLRRIVVKSDDVDWKSVIAKADSLHQKQQEKLKQQEQRNRRREKKRALDLRKKYDAAGSFSVNLLTMKHSEEDFYSSSISSASRLRRAPFRKHRSDATRSIASDVDYQTE